MPKLTVSPGTLLSLIGICGMFLITSCSFKYRENPVKVGVGSRLPSFEIELIDGSHISDVNLNDKTALLVFFNTNCKDCKEELPIINELFLEYGNEVSFLAISRAEEKTSIIDYWRKYNLSIPASPQNDTKVYKLFAEMGIPHMVISKQRIVTYTYNSYITGNIPTKEELETQILPTKLK